MKNVIWAWVFRPLQVTSKAVTPSSAISRARRRVKACRGSVGPPEHEVFWGYGVWIHGRIQAVKNEVEYTNIPIYHHHHHDVTVGVDLSNLESRK